jgi:hypothetical protein
MSVSQFIVRASAASLVLAVSTGALDAQQRPDSAPRATALPGRYDASGLKATLLGSGWRDVWTTPVTVPVMYPDTWNGGLKFDERGGGNQSIVLHFTEKDGWQEYRFRSVNKFPSQALTSVRGTGLGDLVQDQVSAYFPAGPLMVPPLLRSIGSLTVEPRLYVLGDSKQLGVVRDSVVGMLGTFELKGEEGPDDKPGFAGSTSIKGTEKFLEDIAENREHRLDEREFLRVRFLDMLINDPDRTPDNFDWARFGEKGNYTWRPLARDRDQAFIDARGLVNSLIVSRVFPKQLPFNEKFDLTGLTYSTYFLDRRLLQRLSAADFVDAAAAVRVAVNDSVLADAVAQLPREWREQTDADDRLMRVLRARREALPAFAMKYYAWLASEVDVHGTNEADRVDVLRHADGRVTVSIGDPQRPAMIARNPDGTVVTTSGGEVSGGGEQLWYSRTFLPGETREVRIYAGGGDDVAVVRGSSNDAITVRLLGDKGNDVLADSAGGGSTLLYDADGDNRFIPSSGTRIHTREWTPVPSVVGFRVGTGFVPDFGRSRGFGPAFDFHSGAGLIVGGGPRWKSYGFRRLPFASRGGMNVLYGTGNGRFGVNGFAETWAENSPNGFRIEGRATQLETTRFYGFGNDTPDQRGSAAEVNQTVVMLEPAMVRTIGWRAREDSANMMSGRSNERYRGVRPLVGALSVGARAGWLDAEPHAMLTGVTGSEAVGMAGPRATLELDRTDDDAVPTKGWRLDADAAAYPLTSGTDGVFGTALTRASAYLPLGAAGGPHVAFRLGGGLASGNYPAQFAASLGGRSSLRGHSWRRYTGDVAANGGVELRVPVGTVNMFIRSQLGVFALADAGRVWYDGASEGGWHTGVGGGLWLAAFGRAVSFAYANGEGGKFYVKSGLSY